MIHGSSFYIHMHRNLCKVYFCSQGVGVKYCVIGVYGVSTYLDGGKMKELAITKEHYEEQIKALQCNAVEVI